MASEIKVNTISEKTSANGIAIDSVTLKDGKLTASGDTAAGDNATVGYTSAEGLILTGQGSTSDVTLKNDADGTVFTVPTGTDDVLFPDSAKAMWGAASDMLLYHDGTNSYITNKTGALKIATETSGIALTIGHTTSETTVADNLTVTGNINNVTPTEFGLLDGGTSVGSSITLVDADGVIVNDAGSMKTIPASDIKTYAGFTVSSITGATALDVSPADSDEVVISDAGTLKRVDFKYLRNNPCFLVTLASDQDSVAHNTITKVDWDTEAVDSNAAFASNKFTVPANEGGLYQFFTGLDIGGIDDNNSLDVMFYKNGSNIKYGEAKAYQSGADQASRHVYATTLNLAATDYIEVYVNQNSGDDQILESDVCFFSGFKIYTA